MRTLIPVLLTSLIVGCAPYIPRFEGSSGLIQWHKFKTIEEVDKFCAPSVKSKSRFLGCYQMSLDNKVCNVYTVDEPKYMVILGHEVKHCFDGRYHDRYGDTKKPFDPPKETGDY